VTYEAARAICSLEKLTAPQVQPAIYPLQEFLTSPVPAQRFAAVKTLSEVVLRHPSIVAPCHAPLEHLITDSNRSIATLAISTLLKSGVESNVDRLVWLLAPLTNTAPDLMLGSSACCLVFVFDNR
jgi:coatomer protein complex subunit gamma